MLVVIYYVGLDSECDVLGVVGVVEMLVRDGCVDFLMVCEVIVGVICCIEVVGCNLI